MEDVKLSVVILQSRNDTALTLVDELISPVHRNYTPRRYLLITELHICFTLIRESNRRISVSASEAGAASL